MSNAAGKTPVSVLYEYGIKNGIVPHFDLIVSGSAPHSTFTYVAKYGSEQALGKGRSKQEAKHEAARNLLQLLDLSAQNDGREDVKQLMVPHEGSVGYNAVGALYDYCKKHCHPEAVYQNVDHVGPPHAMVFTVKCSVSQLNTLGEARTKKEAKHMAAHKMILLLQKDAGDEPMAVAVPSKIHDEEIILAETNVNINYVPQALLYKDYCNAYLKLPENSQLISELIKDDCPEVEDPPKFVLKIADELVVSINIQHVTPKGNVTELPRHALESDSVDRNTDKGNQGVVMITLQLNPPIVALGDSLYKASHNLLEYIKILCK